MIIKKGKRVKYVLALFTIFCSFWADAQPDKEVRKFLRDFDTTYYRPQRYGLRVFKVDIRVDRLTEKLNQQLIYGKLEDVFFEMSWKTKNDSNISGFKKVEVLGFSNVFSRVKSQLANNILQRVDFIVPVPLSEQLKGYELKNMTIHKGGGRTIKMEDPEHLKEANRITLVFDAKNRLTKFIVSRPVGLETIELKLQKKPWSQGKWVMSEYTVKKDYGIETIESKNSLDYRIVSKFGLLERIKTVTKKISSQPSAKKSDTYESQVSFVTRFSNWRVNASL